MQLAELRVIHLTKVKFNAELSGFSPPQDAFSLDTCQRKLWVFWSKNSNEPTLPKGMQGFHGKEAYLFLLRLSTGLESEIIGETDIFGQVKEAWRKYENSAGTQKLGPWMQRLFEDTKEIRSHYMQNLGGASYGTLVRKLIRDSEAGDHGPVLIVGAGQIAQSVAPFLSGSEVLLVNRDPVRLENFRKSLSDLAESKITVVSGLEAEKKAWQNATRVVVCIPFDSENDSQRVEWFEAGGVQKRILVHLGGRREGSGAWARLPCFLSLDDIFSLQKSIHQVRSVQVARAGKACRDRAILRSIGVSLSVCHGWEDLACFA